MGRERERERERERGGGELLEPRSKYNNVWSTVTASESSM